MPEVGQRLQRVKPVGVHPTEIPGADHFFMRYTKELESSVHAWAARQFEQSTP